MYNCVFSIKEIRDGTKANVFFSSSGLTVDDELVNKKERTNFHQDYKL